MPAEGLKNNGTLLVIFIAHISCQPMMSCKIITDVVMLFVRIVSVNHHFYMINKLRVQQTFCPTFQEYVYVWLDISWNSRKCRKFLLILNYFPNGTDTVPILHNYFAWNYKIEMLMENRYSNNKQITQYDFFICNSKNHWFSQWIREGLLCQARFKTQTYMWDSTQPLSHQCTNKNPFMREIKMTGQEDAGLTFHHEHIKIHLHMEQLLLKTTWRLTRKALPQPKL